MTDPIKALVTALRHKCPHMDMELGDSHSEDWRSLLFDGAHHRFTLLVRGGNGGDWRADLERAMSAHDLCLPGHLIVDVAIEHIGSVGDQIAVAVKARTIEERFAVSV